MRQLVYQVCFTRSQVSLYLWRIEAALKHCKVPKYYDQGCSIKTHQANKSDFDIYSSKIYCKRVSLWKIGPSSSVTEGFLFRSQFLRSDFQIFMQFFWNHLDHFLKMATPNFFQQILAKHICGILQSRAKHLQTFSHFSTTFLQHKWNGTRILSPESECTNCL